MILDSLNNDRPLDISPREFLNYLSSNYKGASSELKLNVTWTYDSQNKPVLNDNNSDPVYPEVVISPGAAARSLDYFLAAGESVDGSDLGLNEIFGKIVGNITTPQCDAE